MDLEVFRRSLPVYNFRQKILDSLFQQNGHVLIVAGETGSGKTTQIPQYLYENNPNVRIIITQPRRVAAITIAQRVSKEKNQKLGDLVGYSVRFDDKYSKELTKIKYVTDGMLIRELIMDTRLSNYDVIIIDEAHERTIQSDLLLALLKRMMLRRSDFKLVVMSATLEIAKIGNYFQTNNIIEISGRTFPIDVYNTDDRQNDYIESTLDTILQVHFQEDVGDILAFLPGQEDIEDIAATLKERALLFPKNAKQLIVNPLYAALPPEVQMAAFESTPLGYRKIVLATNIAETSVTIDGIRYVIDCGLAKIRQFQQQKAIETLLTVPISQAQSMQRAGRAGRQSRGKCFRLYTKETFNKLGKFMLPEILRTNLQQVILQLKAIGIKDVVKFDFLDKPEVEQIEQCIKQLQMINALDLDENLTKHGRNMSSLPLEPQYSHLLLRSIHFGCYEMVLDVVSVMEVENLIYIPRNSKISIQVIMNKFKISSSDHLTKAKILQSYISATNKKSFCTEHFLNIKSLKKAIEIRKQLEDYMKSIKKQVMEDKMEIEIQDPFKRFIQCLTEAMIFKQAYYSPMDQAYRLCGSNQLAVIHPESTLFNLKDKPQHLVFNEVIMTKKVYLRDVTQIQQTKMIIQ